MSWEGSGGLDRVWVSEIQPSVSALKRWENWFEGSQVQIKFLPKRKNLALSDISDVNVNSTNFSAPLNVEVCGQFHGPAV